MLLQEVITKNNNFQSPSSVTTRPQSSGILRCLNSSTGETSRREESTRAWPCGIGSLKTYLQWTQATSCVHQPAEVDMSMITSSSRFPPLQPLTSFCPRTIVQWNSLPLDALTLSADPAQFRATVCLKSPHQHLEWFGKYRFGIELHVLTKRLLIN